MEEFCPFVLVLWCFMILIMCVCVCVCSWVVALNNELHQWQANKHGLFQGLVGSGEGRRERECTYARQHSVALYPTSTDRKTSRAALLWLLLHRDPIV